MPLISKTERRYYKRLRRLSNMTIKQLVDNNLEKGYELKDAQNLAAEEVILRKLASTDLAEHVTLKGGIVMYNLAKNNRRVTQDIDFDLIRYSIDKKSIEMFVSKMNKNNDGFKILLSGQIEDLHQEDYDGVRVHLVIKDKTGKSLKIKLDIGVHTYMAIEQNKAVFSFDSDKQGIAIKVNPPEQIFAEKLIALARLGAISTRYKDLYDLFYLITKCELSRKRVKDILDLFMNI